MFLKKGYRIYTMYFIHTFLIFLTAKWAEGQTGILNRIFEGEEGRKLPINDSEFVTEMMRSGYIKSGEVARAMWYVDQSFYSQNGLFAPSAVEFNYMHLHRAPNMLCRVLEHLKNHLKPGCKALDIDCSTAYLTVCMALMVGFKGTATGLSATKEERDNAMDCVLEANPSLLINDQLKLVYGNLTDGWAERGPYDAIYAASPHLNMSRNWLMQLKVGGRLIVPLKLELLDRPWFIVYDKHAPRNITRALFL